MSVSADLQSEILDITADLEIVLRGEDGKSAYEVAVDNGFVGTEQEWLDSLKGEADRAEAYTQEAREYRNAAQSNAILAGNQANAARLIRDETQAIRDGFAPEVANAMAAIQAEKEEAEQKKLLVDEAAENAHLDRVQADADAEEVRYLLGRTTEEKNVATDAAERARVYSETAVTSSTAAAASEANCAQMWEEFQQFPQNAEQYAIQAGAQAQAAANSASEAEGYKDDTEGLKLEVVGYRNETSRLCSVAGYYASQADASAQAAAASALEAGASAEYVSQRIESEVNSALSTHLAGKLDVNGKAVDSAHADNADTVNNHTVLSDVPANAVFTDTTYETMTAAEATTGTGTTARVITAKVLADKIAEAIASLVDSSPAALDTLNELAAALNNDPDFATTMATALGNKLDKAGGTVTGNLTVNGTLTADVTGNADTATKLATARTINIQDSTATNTGTGASFDGSGNATIKLPATINANITGDVTGNVTGSSGSCTGNAATATSAAACTGNSATSTLLYQNDQTAGFKQIAYADYGVNSCGSLRLAFDAYDGSANNETGKFEIDVKGARSRVAVRQFTDWEHYVREATLLDPAGNTYFPGQIEGHRLRGYGGHVAANAMFDNGGIVLHEKDGVGSTQTDFTYAPSIGFHWRYRIGASLSFHGDGNFYFRAQDGVTRATVDANLNGNAATATKINGKTIPVVSSFNSSTGVLALTSLS